MTFAHLQRGLLLLQQDRHELAATEFRAALVQEPSDAAAHAYLAMCLAEQGEYREATREAEEAIRLAPDSDLPYSALAQVMVRRNQLNLAELAIRNAIQLFPYDADHHAMLAAIKLELRDWPAALDAAEKGLEIDPEHGRCNNLRAMALVKLGRRAEAGQTIDAVLARQPDDALTHANRGWALLHDGQPRKAMEHFREALRLDPSDDWARAGIVEALKARNFIYRWMLHYFLWMNRLSVRTQWAIIIGAFIGNFILLRISESYPASAPYILPVRVAYLAFALMTWLSVPIFNLLLRLSRFGRLALSREQTLAANFIGALLFPAAGALVLRFVTGKSIFMEATLVLVLLCIPVMVLFASPAGWPRRLMIAATIYFAVAGSVIIAAEYRLPNMSKESQLAIDPWLSRLVATFIWGIVVVSLSVNFLANRRAKH